jgi:hypothetical protein
MPCAMRHAGSSPSTGRRLAICALACAVAVSACGGSGSGSVGATTATGYASPFGLSKCMRANGVTNFPDPTNGPGGAGFNGIGRSIGGPPTLIVDGKTFSGPVVAKAEKACSRYLTPSGPPPKLSASQKARQLDFAACMRTHGLPDFPDPIFPSGGGIEIRGGPGFNPQSPAFQHAAQACGRGRVGSSPG